MSIRGRIVSQHYVGVGLNHGDTLQIGARKVSIDDYARPYLAGSVFGVHPRGGLEIYDAQEVQLNGAPLDERGLVPVLVAEDGTAVTPSVLYVCDNPETARQLIAEWSGRIEARWHRLA